MGSYGILYYELEKLSSHKEMIALKMGGQYVCDY